MIGTQNCLLRGKMTDNLESFLDTTYSRDKVLKNMHGVLEAHPAVIHRAVPEALSTSESAAQRLAAGGVLRVGYHPDNLPYTFFNSSGELVGHDIDLANLLASQFECELEFVPFQFESLSAQLEQKLRIPKNIPSTFSQLNFSDLLHQH